MLDIWVARKKRTPEESARREKIRELLQLASIGSMEDILHQIFDRMRAVSESEIVSRTQMNMTADLKEQVAAAKREFAAATREYEAVKAKLMAVIRGESSLPEAVLSEMAEEAKQKMARESEKVSALNAELERSNSRAEEIRKDYESILK